MNATSSSPSFSVTSFYSLLHTHTETFVGQKCRLSKPQLQFDFALLSFFLLLSLSLCLDTLSLAGATFIAFRLMFLLPPHSPLRYPPVFITSNAFAGVNLFIILFLSLSLATRLSENLIIAFFAFGLGISLRLLPLLLLRFVFNSIKTKMSNIPAVLTFTLTFPRRP